MDSRSATLSSPTRKTEVPSRRSTSASRGTASTSTGSALGTSRRTDSPTRQPASAGNRIVNINEERCDATRRTDQQVGVEASIGASLFPEDGKDFSELVDCARSAMQQAKTGGGGRYIRYSDRISFDMGGHNSLAAELRAAVRKNQFELHYQPRVHLASGELVGVEALLRWNHPERGLLTPGDFLATCEEIGLLKTIGYQVIQHACGAQKWLGEQGITDIEVAVNISFSQIQDERFVKIVKDIVSRSGIDPGFLELELTESIILKSPEAIKERMNELRQLGITFSLDDFGTGFSQLSHLTELPISSLKIDGAFVRNIPGNEHQEAVCTMIIEVARRLGLDVVAEGAETHEQVTFLKEHDCQQVQGFYYSPAIPLQQMPLFVEKLRQKRNESLFSHAPPKGEC